MPPKPRLCACGCKGSLEGYSLRREYKPGHRQRVYQRKRDGRVREALAMLGRAESKDDAQTAGGAARRASSNGHKPAKKGKRADTVYIVLEVTRLGWRKLDTAKANKAELAKAEVRKRHGLDVDHPLNAVAARNLQ